MPIFERLRYTLYVLIAVTMVFMLTLSISEGIGLIRNLNVSELMFHPLYILPVLFIGFLIAPALSERIPISGDSSSEKTNVKPQFGYTVRVVALALLALVLAMLGNLVVFLLGKLT